MTKRLFMYIILILSCVTAQSQTIRLIRTDVDSVRSNFITATYLFGIDVVAEDVYKCNGVEFELTYNATNFVKFSEWRSIDFGGKPSVVVIPRVDTLAGQGKLYVLVLSGDEVPRAVVDTPKVIHLEFAVSQAATNAQKVTFSFNNAHAIVNQDSAGEVLKLTSTPTVYDIHGFVYVWPGDTDNNGVVNQIDMDMIALHLGSGVERKQQRTFKRQNAGTVWSGQRVLAWDSSVVTFADCDGDGNITVKDMLIIPLNFARQHSQSPIVDTKTTTPVIVQSDGLKLSDNTVLYPILVEKTHQYLAASGKFTLLNNDDYTIVGATQGNIFKSGQNFINHYIYENTLEFASGSFDKNELGGEPGTLVYIALEPKKDSPEPPVFNISELTGISSLGDFFPISSLTSIEENNDNTELNIQQSGDLLEINLPTQTSAPSRLSICDLMGRYVISNQPLGAGQSKISLTELSPGAYIAIIDIGAKRIVKRLIK